MSRRRATHKRWNGRQRLKAYVLVPLAVVLTLLAGLVTVSERLAQPFLPTWEEIFETVGLRETPPLSDLENELRIDVIDVGNADAVLIRNGAHSMLIDAGTNTAGSDVVRYLRSQGVQRLDLVIATHADVDHIGGMDDVIEAFEIDTYLMASMPVGLEPTTKSYFRVLQALERRSVSITEAEPGMVYALGEAEVEILGPARDFEDSNNMSVVCRICYGKRRFLFMGDAEKEAEAALIETGQALSADVIKIGHHGSNTSTTSALLDAVTPRYALITCGLDNPYNHPHPDTMNALAERRIASYRSDLCGTIVVRCDGESITFETER